MLTVVTGINWGDEGKGRVIDLLAEKANVVARFQGGDNAGHTVVVGKEKYVMNLLPSGILHPDVVCVLGPGMVIDLEELLHEMDSLRKKGISITPRNLKISDKATISMPWHRIQDELEEERLSETEEPLDRQNAVLHMRTVTSTARKRFGLETSFTWRSRRCRIGYR